MSEPQPRILSVNTGAPQKIETRTSTVLTSIFKSPSPGRLKVNHHNIEGDRQSDLRVHGGPYKAVYCYPREHYEFWKVQLAGADLTPGMFGENLTTEGLTEETVAIGDRFRFGTAILAVTQPRMPCFKLALRFNRSDMVRLFWNSERSGFYLSVVEEGDLAAGDSIEALGGPKERISVRDVVRLYRGTETDPDLLERALQAPLYGSWKSDLREKRAQPQLVF